MSVFVLIMGNLQKGHARIGIVSIYMYCICSLIQVYILEQKHTVTSVFLPPSAMCRTPQRNNASVFHTSLSIFFFTFALSLILLCVHIKGQTKPLHTSVVKMLLLHLSHCLNFFLLHLILISVLYVK